MTNRSRRHPFEVGEQYRNENGVYTVVRIEEPNIVIQYENGRSLQSSIRLQARIWERIQTEDAIEAEKAASKTAARRRGAKRNRAAFGRDFHGLQEGDFRRDVTGTSWRRRSELAGLLAARLSELSGQIFESHAVYRRAEVYIVQPQHWNADTPQRGAKFFFALSETEAVYGFYIEKSTEAMDGTWDWTRTLPALAGDKTVQAHTLVAMEHCDVQWRIHPGGAATTDPAPLRVSAAQEALSLHEGDETRPLDWAGLVELLEAVPDDQSCDAYLATSMEKVRALELGVGLASEVANVYSSLLPLYASSVQR